MKNSLDNTTPTYRGFFFFKGHSVLFLHVFKDMFSTQYRLLQGAHKKSNLCGFFANMMSSTTHLNS